ncbi:MAG TPA: hypothetical protein VIX60_00835, partial [Candidatus Cybelea sp.]
MARHRMSEVVWPQPSDLFSFADLCKVPSADVVAVQERSVRRSEDEGRPVPFSAGSGLSPAQRLQ